MALLEVKNLCKNYHNFQLKDITFQIPKGYIMGCVGQNGAGKTTTINLITHLCNANNGSVILDGLSYEKDPHQYVEKIGFIGDESYYPKNLYVFDIAKIMKLSFSTFDAKKFQQYLQQFQLNDQMKIGEMSRGMKVKLMFAGTLSRDTKILILDESTNGLDPLVRQQILSILQEYVSDGEHSILFSTHMLNDLEDIADFILFIENGSVILNDTKDEIISSYLIVKGSEADLNKDNLKRLIGKTGHAYHFEAMIQANDACYFDKRFILEKPTIDQIVLYHLTQGGNIA